MNWLRGPCLPRGRPEAGITGQEPLNLRHGKGLSFSLRMHIIHSTGIAGKSAPPGPQGGRGGQVGTSSTHSGLGWAGLGWGQHMPFLPAPRPAPTPHMHMYTQRCTHSYSLCSLRGSVGPLLTLILGLTSILPGVPDEKFIFSISPLLSLFVMGSVEKPGSLVLSVSVL